MRVGLGPTKLATSVEVEDDLFKFPQCMFYGYPNPIRPIYDPNAYTRSTLAEHKVYTFNLVDYLIILGDLKTLKDTPR